MEEIIKYLGNFHPVVLHLPIGAFLFTFLLFLSQRFLKSNFDPAIRLGLLFSFITSIITSIFGYILRLFGEYDATLVDRHMWLALATTLMIGIVMYLHKKQRSFNQILSCFILSTVFLTVTGHNGGSLTHGKDYLKLPTIDAKISVINYDSIHVFNQVISPILDSKCVKCHNASKSKGSLMLSSVNKIQLGGERGQIIKSSSSINSRLYTYLNLPIDDKMHMPPDGNSQLNENEKELIRMWIDEGANFYSYRKISNDNFSNEIINYLPKPSNYVDPPSKKNLIKLVEGNFRIERISYKSNLIDVKFTGKTFKQKDFNSLAKVDENIQRLDFSGVNLSQISLNKLKSFENLNYLNLNNTSINSDDLIRFLPETITTLIISNNDLKINVFEYLISNPNIKRVFAYNTIDDKETVKQIANNSNNKIFFGISLEEFASNVPLRIPTIKFESKTLFSDSLQIEIIKDISNPTYRYSLDGEEPDSLSLIYKNPITIKKSSKLKIKAFKKGSLPSSTKEINYLKVADKIYDLKLYSLPTEPYDGDNFLTDNQLGTNNFGDGNWYGFLKSTPKNSSKNSLGDLIAEFSISDEVKEIGISCLTAYGAYILYPTKIQLYDISSNEEKIIYSKEIKEDDNIKYNSVFQKKIFKVPVKSNVSKVKLKVISNKKLPVGHPAEGEPAWLFVDEILLF